MKIERIRECLGCAGCRPAMLGSLPTNAGKLHALPNPET
jgi:hypothetical protein